MDIHQRARELACEELARQDRVRKFQDAVLSHAEPYIRKYFVKAIVEHMKTGEMMNSREIAQLVVDDLFKD